MLVIVKRLKMHILHEGGASCLLTYPKDWKQGETAGVYSSAVLKGAKCKSRKHSKMKKKFDRM